MKQALIGAAIGVLLFNTIQAVNAMVAVNAFGGSSTTVREAGLYAFNSPTWFTAVGGAIGYLIGHVASMVKVSVRK